MNNGMMLQGFSWYLPADGQHWKRMARLAPTLAQMGITAVWLPPAYKAAEGGESVGYSVYDTWDLGEFDQCGSVRTKYGTKKEYLAAIAALQKAGIQVLGDIVLNHRMGGEETEHVRAFEVDAAARESDLTEEKTISAWTRYRFPGRNAQYSDFQWDWTCFHGTDWDEDTHQTGIFRFAGKKWDEDVDHTENGNFDYLMGNDVDVNNPAVEAELVRWGEWYIKTTGLDGLRLDALKHVSKSFFRRWIAHLREKCGCELFTVGEYWSPELSELEAYLGEDMPMSLFDVPLHYKLFGVSNSMGTMDLAHLFDGTLVASNPVHAVTFVDNHDTQPGQALASTVASWFKPSAYMLILLREAGYPCVFYGDLFGAGAEAKAGEEGEDTPALPVVRNLPLLMEIRQRHAYGAQHDYFDDKDLIGWTREGDDEHAGSGIAVVITDGEGGTKHMYVGTQHAGKDFVCVVGQEDKIVIDEEGYGDFSAAPGSGSVYLEAKSAEALKHDRILRRAETEPSIVPTSRKGAHPVPANFAPWRRRK